MSRKASQGGSVCGIVTLGGSLVTWGAREDRGHMLLRLTARTLVGNEPLPVGGTTSQARAREVTG